MARAASVCVDSLAQPAITSLGGDDRNTPQLPVQLGERLADRYTVERVIGMGGMGVVVAARHEQLGQTVAIKILSVSTELHPDAVNRFVREARAAASLRSEHIARVMDAGVDDQGRHFLVMEYLEGEDLASVIRRGEVLSVAQTVGYLLQACEALAEAHTQGIIHRDLKPENVFLTRRVDGSPLIKVLDFGISKMMNLERQEGAISSSGPRSLLGSPLYMSPEQIRTPWNIDPRSDVWALGVITFELLTGQRPFKGESLSEILASVLTDAPPALSSLRTDLPPPLVLVVASCLEKEADKRMPSVGALARALHEWAPSWSRDSSKRARRLAGIATEGTGSVDIERVLPPTSSPAVTAGIPRRRGRVAALSLLGAACGSLSLLILWKYNGARPAAPAAVPAAASSVGSAAGGQGAFTPAAASPVAAEPAPAVGGEATSPSPARVARPRRRRAFVPSKPTEGAGNTTSASQPPATEGRDAPKPRGPFPVDPLDGRK